MARIILEVPLHPQFSGVLNIHRWLSDSNIDLIVKINSPFKKAIPIRRIF
jgi:hypothetical protein